MDAYEEAEEAPQKQAVGEIIRPPLVPSDKNNNGVSVRRPRNREVGSRYRSPTPCAPRRCPSPNTTRTPTTPAPSLPKRSQSTERKRPSTPTSPRSPSTPVQDSSVDVQPSSRRITTNRHPEGLWPATMRSLSVSFQSDAISVPISKREKPVASALSDRTLKSSSNVAHKQLETPSTPRKPTPERKMSPAEGKNAPSQSENSKPVDSLNPRLVDQHRWPSRIGGKLSSGVQNRSIDLSDKPIRTPTLPSSGMGVSLQRRIPLATGVNKPLQKSCSDDAARLATFDDSGGVDYHAQSGDNISLHLGGLNKLSTPSSSERTILTMLSARSQSLPVPVSRPASPSRTSAMSSSFSKGVNPSQTRPSTTAQSRGASPSRSRPSSPSRQATDSTSVLSFVADIRKIKKGANHLEDAHQLKLLYNRFLQWRFANAQADGVLYVQKIIAEKTLYNVWITLLELWDSVMNQRITFQQLRLERKLDSVLNGQMNYLNDWALIERDHFNSLSGSIEDLQSSTLRLPVTLGARADIETVKGAICSAVDVMQAIGSSICPLFSKVEGVNSLISELAELAAQGRALLDNCEALLASTAAMQVEECSFTTYLIQLEQALQEG